MDDELTTAEYALFLLLEGEQEHDIAGMTGHDREHCAFIWAAYQRVRQAMKEGATLPLIPDRDHETAGTRAFAAAVDSLLPRGGQ